MAPNNNKVVQTYRKQIESVVKGQQASMAGCTDKLKCYRCKKVKPLMGYSNKQQEVAKESQRVKKVPIISCIECSDQTVVEIKCVACKKYKGKDKGFSKVQARFPETARCFQCVEEQTTLNAIHPEDGFEDSDPGTDSDEEGYSYDNTDVTTTRTYGGTFDT